MKHLFPLLKKFCIGPSTTSAWPTSLLTLALRLLFGWQILQTGLGKLQHIDGIVSYFTRLNLAMPLQLAWTVACVETMGGAMLLLGLATRFHALALSAVLMGALLSAHRADLLKDGLDALFVAPPLPFLVATACLAVLGAGKLSLDNRFEWAALSLRREGTEAPQRLNAPNA